MNLYTEEQLELKNWAKAFMEREVAPVVAECDRKGEAPMEAIRKGMDAGLHLLELPEEYGGMGLGAEDYSIIAEEMAVVDAGFGTIFGASDLLAKAVLTAGTPEQKKYCTEYLGEGHLGAFCLTEPEAGSDAASLRTTAVLDGDSYILNGTKCFIPN